MYDFPDDFTGDCFLNRRPESVQFTVNTVALAFDNENRTLPNLSITTTSPFRHHSSDGDHDDATQYPVRASKLMQLIDVAIKAVKIIRPGTLILEFEDGQSLTLLDDTPGQYESYYISLSGKTIII